MNNIFIVKDKVYLRSVQDIMDFTSDMETLDGAEIRIVFGDNKFNAKSIVSVLNCVKFNSPIQLECISKNNDICGVFLERTNKYKEVILS